MKRISFFLAVTLLAAPELLRAQDAAVEERLNKLTARVQDLEDAKDAQNKRIEELAKGLRALQDQQGKPNTSYASQEDLKQLADKLQEIDRKRQEDNDLILKRIEGLGKALGSSARPAGKPREMDRKGREDNNLILKRIEGLGRARGSSARPAVAPSPATPPADAA